jgi:DNA mismatch repair protein MutS2
LIQLLQARHPLLDPKKVVPIDVELDKQTYILVITGPNTGGKTVTLKTVGLLSLMAQAGMQIPAMSGSRLSIFEDIFADIGDEQSIEQSLSTFSGHITQLVYILEHANPHCLVLLDELGAGTDPQEGSALAMAVLSHLLESRITSFVATHYPELKAYAHAKDGVVNASVEFNLETLQPTYHLTIGLPGRSNALAIAERLGLPREIIQAAKAEINPTDLRAEDLLDEIHRQRDLTREARMKAETLRKEAEIAHNEVVSRLEKIEDERFLILEKTRQQAQEEIEKLREELDALRHELVKARQPLDIIEQVEEIIEEQEVEVGQPIVRKTQAPKRKQSTGPLRLGERVIVTSLNQEGVITAITENDVEVQMGMLRLRARKTEIKRKIFDEVIEEQEDEIKITGKTSIPVVESPGVELDIRGQRVEEALDLLQRYLERAYLAGLPYVRIIHGKGTGKLRQVVRETLGASGHISRWETGNESEGGDGVTVAFVKK